jgi:hypothetical protein
MPDVGRAGKNDRFGRALPEEVTRSSGEQTLFPAGSEQSGHCFVGHPTHRAARFLLDIRGAMPAPATHLRELICPDGMHRVFAGAEALSKLRALPRERRESAIRALCDLGEIAALRASVVEFWEETLLRLRAEGVTLLYSVDRQGSVLLHHVLAGDVM